MSVEFAADADGLLAVWTVRDGNVMTLCLRGELDLATLPIAAAQLERAEAEQTVRLIILDLNELEFIDSTAVAWLVAAQNRHRDDGNRLRVTRSTAKVARVLELAGIAPRLPYLD